MPVTTNKSDVFRLPNGDGVSQNANKTAGRLRVCQGKVSNATDDLAGSTFELCRVPSHAIIDPTSAFQVENWGFVTVKIGTGSDTGAFIDVATSAATTQNPVTQFDVNHGKELWEVLGLEEDPCGKISLFAHADADATAAGSMLFDIRWFDE
ncbi:MAG: hypothetical protein JKY93_03595 [Gammaproteobacteria bacterium]|nr:hypothetical protein [Gammaproteobacteria bacterium]